MQEVPRVKKIQIAIQSLATYVIVIGVSNHSGSNKMESSALYGPVHHGYIKITSKDIDVEVLVEITERGF